MAKKPKAKAKTKPAATKAAATKPAAPAAEPGEPYRTPENKVTPAVTIWSPADAQRALAAGKAKDGSPEVGDSFTPTPGDGPTKQKLGPPPPRTPQKSSLAGLEAAAEERGREVDAEQAATAQAVRDGKTVGPPAPRARTVTKPGEEQPATEPDQPPDSEVGAGIDTGPEQDPKIAKELVQQIKDTTFANEVVDELFQMFGFEQGGGGQLLAFYQKRERVTLELQDGTFAMPAVAVVKSQYSVTLILPLDVNGTSFIPRPGTQLSLRLAGPGEAEKVYFPGAYCEIAPLKLALMTFIREQENEDDGET